MPPPVLRPRFADRAGPPRHPRAGHRAASTPRPATARRTTRSGWSTAWRSTRRWTTGAVSPTTCEFFAGQFVFDANTPIIAELREDGTPAARRALSALLSPLLALQEAGHLPGHRRSGSSPWSKTGLRQKALEAIDRVQWIPAWGRERIYGMIENRPDWCISRQRSWGVPITVFYCDECGRQLLLNRSIMDHVCRMFAERQARTPGSSATAPRSCRAGTVCPECGGDQLRQGDRHPRRLVRLRASPTPPCCESAPGPALAGRSLPRGQRPAPRLVPQPRC